MEGDKVQPSFVLPLVAAIEGMASLLATTALSSKYFARLLRQDGRGMWPDIGRGRRDGRVTVRHILFHLAANVLCEGQPNEGPRVAHEFGLLHYRYKQVSQGSVPEGSNALMPPTSMRIEYGSVSNAAQDGDSFLIDEICALVEEAALQIVSNGKIDYDNKFVWPVIRITLGDELFPMSATFTRNDPDTVFKTETKFYTVDRDLLSGIVPHTIHRNKLARTEVIFSGNELETLARFVAKVGQLEFPKPSIEPGSSVEASTTPETKKASGTGIHEGLPSERPAPRAQTVVPDKTQHATGKGRKQSSQTPNAVSGAGQRSTPDRKGVKKWTSRSVSPKARDACSDMFERLTA